MDKKELILCLRKITPSSTEKQEMLENILRSRNGAAIPMKRAAKKLSAAAVVALIICTLLATAVSALYLLNCWSPL